MMQASLLDDQERVLEEVIRASVRIIEQQNRVRDAAQLLKEENRGLEIRSRDLQRVLRSSQQQLESQGDLSIPIEMINKLAGEVRGLKEEQRSRFEQLEHLAEETRGMVENQMRVLTDRQLESRASLGDTPLTPLTLGDTPLTIG